MASPPGGEPAETDIVRLSESWPGLDLSEVAAESKCPDEPRLKCIQRSGKPRQRDRQFTVITDGDPERVGGEDNIDSHRLKSRR